ncbi:hypothetical protein MUP46_04130 [Patescibacteria group bacterium]|nr:hypothetical protein [Patescibacteria group bacterium]
MKKLSSPVLYIREAFKIYFEKKNLIYFLKLGLLFLVLSIATSIFFVVAKGTGSNAARQPAFILPLVASAIPLAIIGIWFQAATYEAVIRAVEGRTLVVKETLLTSWKKTWCFFLVSLARGLIMALGFVLLIIPGIIFGIWFSFSLFIQISKGTSVKESLAKSKALTKGRFWPILGRFSVFLLIYILIQMVFANIPYVGPVFAIFMGPFFLIPFYLLYKELS